MDTIMNFHQYSETLSSGGQPTVEQIKKMKAAGIERIINLSPVSTPNYLKEEAELTESLGISYLHFPVNCSDLKDHHYTLFKQIMAGSESVKTFVHCGGNIKSSSLIHMYQVREQNRDEKDSLTELLQMQTPEQKWYDYFKKFGMEGISHTDLN